MKVKFLSKKQREALKAEKQSTGGNTVITQAQTNHTEVTRSPYQQPINERVRQQDQEERQRSRDYKKISQIQPNQELSKFQVEERNLMKNRILGLVKTERPPRHFLQYRTDLRFEWDKSDDTSGGFQPLVGLKNDSKSDQKLGQSWKNKPYEQMTERDWRIFREDNEIYIRGGKACPPFREWTQINSLSPILIQNLKRLGFKQPKPIQMQAITIGLGLSDMMAIAPTGQGKTLGYLVPILEFLRHLPRPDYTNFDKGPYALVLLPARELAQQVQGQFIKISEGLGMRAFLAVGGKQIQMQSMDLSKGCDLLIGTPGRVKDLLNKRYLSLERLSWVVIDQADKMISQNLSEQIEEILKQGGEESVLQQSLQRIGTEQQVKHQRNRVTHMFSATMIPQIEQLSRSYLAPNFTYLTIGQPGGGKKQIDQVVQIMDETRKADSLGKVLKSILGPIIVFVSSRQKCDKIGKKISQRWGRSIGEYHGGKGQEQRQRVISQFRSGKVDVLLATDLAGRGLDVKGVAAVVNYDAPKNISEFIHRTGRTGRAGMKGKAFTFLTSEDQALFYDLRVFLERNGFTVPESLREHVAAQVRPGAVAHVARSKQIVYTN